MESGVGPLSVDHGLMAVLHEVFDMAHFVVNGLQISLTDLSAHLYSEREKTMAHHP